MDPESKVGYARLVLLKLLETNDRLARGAQLRKTMLEELKAGKKPEGYRPTWIRETARRVVDALLQAARDFDVKHSDDRASVDDILDVVSSVRQHFEKKNK